MQDQDIDDLIDEMEEGPSSEPGPKRAAVATAYKPSLEPSPKRARLATIFKSASADLYGDVYDKVTWDEPDRDEFEAFRELCRSNNLTPAMVAEMGTHVKKAMELKELNSQVSGAPSQSVNL